MVIAAVPSTNFGNERFKAGDELELKASLHDARDNIGVIWETTLLLNEDTTVD
jgi:hypothetical protein